MNTAAENTPFTALTFGIIAVIIGALAISGVKVYGWIREQVTKERKEWEERYDKDLADVKAENVALRQELNQVKIEIHDLQNGKAKALRSLGRALGADTVDHKNRLIDEAMNALAPSA